MSDDLRGNEIIDSRDVIARIKELAEDIGAVSKAQSWPNNYIDWEEAAGQLQQDYFSVDFGSYTYWIRS